MNLKHLLIPILLMTNVFAQNGGQYTFDFMQFSNSARLEALGGYAISLSDDDASLGVINPAILNIAHHGQFHLNYVNYFADSDYGFSSYAHHLKNIGTLSTSIMYANYGKFDYADASGERNGSQFSANDLLIQIGLGRSLDSNFSIGGNFKLGSSFLEAYNAFGFAFDVALNYQNRAKEFGAGLLIQNVGMQLKSYTANNREPLPLSINLGISKKLGHAPFRFTFTYHDIQRWNLTYFDVSTQQSTDPLTGLPVEIINPSFLTQFFNHIVIGSEFLLSKNFHLRFGYNFKRRFEMKPISRPGTTGISWGIGFKVKKLKLSYANSKYHFSGTSNHITLSKTFGKAPKVDAFYNQH
ncbi:MAG: type IX secretion system protein PorQ [Parvicellaceae bacterium]